MDEWARRLWYAKRGLIADDQKSYGAWALAPFKERQAARDEVAKAIGDYTAGEYIKAHAPTGDTER